VNSRIVVLSCLALWLSFFQLGGFTLFDVDEAVFSEASREMLETGDWLTPTYDYENRYDKPILFYWLQAASLAAIGTGEFAARLPSALAGLAMLGLVFLIIRRLHGEYAAFWSALCLLLSIEFTAYSHAAVTDMALTLFISFSILSYLMSLSDPRHRYVLGFYLGSALAFLTKGLIGIVFPWAVVILYSAVRRELLFKQLLSASGIALFLVVGMPWYVLEFRENGMEFFNALFMKHHVARFLNPNSGHSGSLLYYVPVLLIGFFPWVAYLPRAIVRAFRSDGHTSAVATIWFLFVVVFFSFSNTKLPNYILSSFPPAAILAGLYISKSAGDRENRPELWFLALMSALLSGVFIAAPYFAGERGIHVSGLIPVGLVFAAFTLTLLWKFLKGKWTIPAQTMAVAMAGILSILLLSVIPSVNEELQGELFRFTKEAGEDLKPDFPLSTYRINNPSVAFYLGRRVERSTSREDLLHLKDGSDRVMVITRPSLSGELEGMGFIRVRKGRRYVLHRYGANE